MASFGQNLIQGLATGFQGDTLATDLLAKQTQLKKSQQELKASEYETSADKLWSKAVMDVLAGQQTPIAPPIAPQPGQASVPGGQPGQASVPMTQGPATPPVAPGTPGPGAAAPAPSPAAATLQTLGTQPAPQPSTMSPLNASALLQDIQKNNPNLDDGVMSAIVNKHLLPLMSDQQNAQYKQFQQQMEMSKFTAAEQDKLNTLLFRYQDLQERMASAGDNRALRLQLAELAAGTKGEMADVRRTLIEQQIQEAKDRDNLIKAQTAATQARADAAATGGKKFEEKQAALKSAIDTVQKAFNFVKDHPHTVGITGEAVGLWQDVKGQFKVPTGKEQIGGQQGDASVTRSAALITEAQQAIHKIAQSGYLSPANITMLEDQIKGMNPRDSATTVMESLSTTYDMLQGMMNQAGVGNQTPNATQIQPDTGEPVAAGDYKTLTDVADAVAAGKMTDQQAIAYAAAHPDLQP